MNEFFHHLFAALGVTVPDLPQLFPRGNSHRTGINLSLFDELPEKKGKDR